MNANDKGASTMTTMPTHLVHRIDSAITTGLLPTNEPCSRVRAMCVTDLKSNTITGQDVADWINANRINR